LPGQAAQPAPTTPAAETISFEQYRDWRNNFIERRRDEIAAQLAAADLSPERKARLERSKSYYEWFAGLSEAERNRRYRERFARIDTDHDGTIDAAERSAWRDKQRAFYHRDRPASRPASAEPH
jgi:hypothetical protein